MDYQAFVPTTFQTSVPVLATGTTTTLSTSNTMNYCINGKSYSLAAWSNTATPTTDVVTGAAFNGVKANKGCIFIVGLNAAKAMRVVQGTITDLDTSGAFVQAPQIGPMPDNFCPIGYVIIKAGSTANNTTGWVFGTSNVMGVTGITFTCGDLMSWPGRPIIS